MRTVIILALLLLGTVFLNVFERKVLSSQDSCSGKQGQKVLSNWYWVRGYGSWLEKDEARLKDNYSFATALDPFNLTYWSLAAHTLAFDLPVWELNYKAAENGDLNDEKTAAIRQGFAEEALAFFDRSHVYFESDTDWYLTASVLAETALNDPVHALRYLQKAVALPEFPYPVGRSYGRLLIEAGQLEAAHSFLISWLPSLDGDSFEARRTEIRNLILTVEKDLYSSSPN